MNKKRKNAVAAVLVFALAAALAMLVRPGQKSGNTAEFTEPTLPQSEFSAADFVMEGEYLACLAGETVLGIDVSHHQQAIDWQEVKSSGIQFAMIRLGYRGLGEGRLYVDEYAAQNLRLAREAGLQVGAYFYSQAISVEEAQAEAGLALEILDGFALDLPLAFDWEQENRTADVDVQTVTDCALAFCAMVEDAGYRSMIYFNSFQALELMDLQQLMDYPWWLAKYDLTTEFPCRFDIWQYTCTGSVPGIQGNVDVNVMVLEEMA